MRRPLDEDAGQVIVLFAVSLPLFLALLLLAIDGGRLLVERERLRTAAQLAAEAAVSLAGDPPRPSGAAPRAGLAAGAGGATASPRLPTEREVRDIAQEAIRRNLGEGGAGVRTSIVRRDPFTVSVRVEREFASTIQRIRFAIAGAGAAQLGQSP